MDFCQFSDFADILLRCEIFNWDRTNQKLYILFLTFAQMRQAVVLIPPMVLSLESQLWVRLPLLISLQTFNYSLKYDVCYCL